MDAQELAWGEYKLLQDKIDRFDEAGFRVRSWAVSLVSALILGGSISSLHPVLFLLLLPVVGAFHAMEGVRNAWREALSHRVSRLEAFLNSSADRDESARVAMRPIDGCLPGISNAIGRKRNDLEKSAWSRYAVLHAGRLFYSLLYALVLLSGAAALLL